MEDKRLNCYWFKHNDCICNQYNTCVMDDDLILTVYVVVSKRYDGSTFIAGCFGSHKKAINYCGDTLNVTSYIHKLNVA